MKSCAPLLAALALALCLGSAAAGFNLQLRARVLGCNGQPVAGAVVRISGCVDNGLTGRGSIGISAATNGSGIASFLEHPQGAIQYCWGATWNKCRIEVVDGVGRLRYDTQSLVHNRREVTPREWLCSVTKCCNPCAPDNRAEASCTHSVMYTAPVNNGLLEFRPKGGCPVCTSACKAWVQTGTIFGFPVYKQATGECSESSDFDSRRALLQDDAAVDDSEILTEVPADAIMLNDDGSEVVPPAEGRRLHTFNSCPRGWKNSWQHCSNDDCGYCCIRSSN